MPKYHCVAEGCNSDERKRGRYGFMASIRFFPFPTKKSNPRLRKKWLELLRREDFVPSRYDRICSRHFVYGEPTDDHPYPELFNHNNYKESENVRGICSIQKRANSCIADGHAETTHYRGTEVTDTMVEVPLSSIKVDENGICSAFCLPITHEVTVETTDSPCNVKAPFDHDYVRTKPHYDSEPTYNSAEIQTEVTMSDLDDMERKISTLEKKLEDSDEVLRQTFVNKVTSSDNSVKSYLGLPSITALFGLFAILDTTSRSLKYWRGTHGTHHQTNYQTDESKRKTGPSRKLSRFHEFLLTVLRIRLALPIFVLADLFGVSVARVSQIFTTWINYMHVVFSPMLKWPDSRRVKQFMPRSFRNAFPRTTCIIDCTEFFIQRPRTPTAQVITYSSYKHHNTLKALVAITPTGAFTFISNLWGGNVSDRYITANSGFLDHICEGDEVMADRGFVIRDLLLEKKATLNIPPFTKKCKWGKGKCLTARDITRTKNIAKLRIHVEGAIGRLKSYKLLSNTMPLKLKPLANQIIKVCAFFCNLQPPLVKK